MNNPETVRPVITYDTSPEKYKHWSLACDGEIATLALNINEDAGIRPGYKLKLNSYDLGVDMELHDALQRVRFEHPEVRTVVVTSGKERIFCSGANIFMLGLSTHAWKVNFCKFTNETRNGIEDSSRYSGLKFLAACNGTTAGGGYELALACDEILLVDDRSSAVSLPEVPLLGVLPGTGGLTRVTDKRRVRRDHADIFCTLTEGIRAQRAKEWRLIDDFATPQAFAEKVKQRATELAAQSDRPADAKGVALPAVKRTIDAAGYHYETVDVVIDRAARRATLTVSAPKSAVADDIDGIVAAGASWWPLLMARELDAAILMLRTNDLEVGTWVLKTSGDAAHALAADAVLNANRGHWFVRETIGMLRRTLARLDVTSRTLIALVERDSCFAGTLAELLFAADRGYMLSLPDAPAEEGKVTLSTMNFGDYPMVNGQYRLAARFYGEEAPLAAAKAAIGQPQGADTALALGLVTAAPDDLDWDEEIRIVLEERASLSPDALTGMEANLRFGPGETMETRVFGRLSAWQNWIFIRPNAVGEGGALKVFGSGNKAKFNWERV
ncbi:MAG: benzoyl-CoA-dihydrodiol lyase [Betaproteobacteria bacterium]|nr:benzoyl-CoA-dihydrodiol lyase [Betaproteobacteria bacterium]